MNVPHIPVRTLIIPRLPQKNGKQNGKLATLLQYNPKPITLRSISHNPQQRAADVTEAFLENNFS